MVKEYWAWGHDDGSEVGGEFMFMTENTRDGAMSAAADYLAEQLDNGMTLDELPEMVVWHMVPAKITHAVMVGGTLDDEGDVDDPGRMEPRWGRPRA